MTPVAGGSHAGWGTANYLVGLGPDSYLEIVGPDTGQPAPAQPRPFGIDELESARLVTWAVHPDDLDATVERARRDGYDPGPPRPMSRRTPEGDELAWRLTPARGLLPFLIDWGSTPHPASRGLPAVALESLALRHPEPSLIERQLAVLGVVRTVDAGDRQQLVAVLRTPGGRLHLG